MVATVVAHDYNERHSSWRQAAKTNVIDAQLRAKHAPIL